MKSIIRTAVAVLILSAVAEGVSSQTRRVLANYDVRDILATARDFPMRRFNTDVRESKRAENSAREAVRERFLADVNAHLKKTGLPASAYSIRLLPDRALPHDRGTSGMLIVNGASAAHQAVSAYLAHRRALTEAIIHVEARVFRVLDPAKNLPKHLGREPIGDQDLLFMLDAAQARAVRRDLAARANKKGSGISAVAAPRISTFHGQRANITIANQQAYVAAYNVVKLLGGQTTVADPVVKTIEEGMGIEVKVELASDGDARARIEVAYQNAELERPIQEKKTRCGTIQIPRVTSVDLDFTVHLPLPGHLLLASKARPNRGVDLVLLDFARHERKDLLKKHTAAVKAAGPVIRDAKGARRVFFIAAGTRDGLEKGRTVRLLRTGDKGGAKLMASGIVSRAYEDACEVTAPLAADAPALSTADLTSWWAQWGVRLGRVKKRL